MAAVKVQRKISISANSITQPRASRRSEKTTACGEYRQYGQRSGSQEPRPSEDKKLRGNLKSARRTLYRDAALKAKDAEILLENEVRSS